MNQLLETPWRSGAIAGLLAGLLVGAAMMSVAWQHNPQGEIHNDLGVSWGYWLFIGASWTVPVSLVFGATAGLILRILKGA